jgi:hypothetical protein
MEKIMTLLLFSIIEFFHCNLAAQDINGMKQVVIKWASEKPRGRTEVLNGDFISHRIIEGTGKIAGNAFRFTSSGSGALEITVDNARLNPGSGATIITVHNGAKSFSFFLRDVTHEYPVFIPAYQAAVCPAGDKRSYLQVADEISNRNLATRLQQINNEPEESFESASMHTRNQKCPVWLGISRDIRLFEIHPAGEMDRISPKMASEPLLLPEADNTSADYTFLLGRGQGVEQSVTRRLDEGILPILHTTMEDEDVTYTTTCFVSTEVSALNINRPMGTHYLVADNFSGGHMFTAGQQEMLVPLLLEELNKPEETVLYFRAEAINNAGIPRYAWFRTIKPGTGWWERFHYSYDKEQGFSSYSPDRVFGISKMNGLPMPDEEMAVLLRPNEKAVFEFFLPHKPVSKDRAIRLSGQSYAEKLKECRDFWHAKLSRAAQIKIPETRIQEMIQAGLLHLDLITYGLEPEGTLAPCIGVYSPIGTESSPIIQFYNSIGLEDEAKRSIMYFLDKQHDNGMIQNFGGYMVETGAVLWSMGEYYRYTDDTAWVYHVKNKVLKACQFLLDWRERNKIEELRGNGYGMIDGKVADPEDPYHQFMLNAYGYLGISRAAEMLEKTDPARAEYLNREADAWKQDIRTSVINSLAHSPVVPLGDGTWCPTLPPWTETIGPRSLCITGENFMSHGTFTVPDALLGPMYLIFCEVLDADDPISTMLLNYHSELLYQRNTAFSQPYYSRHDWVQLKMGMAKSFLKTYYNAMSALADREIYTFWEHLYQASVHKTHEEAWFLMATRWMLYLEEGKTLRLLPGIPRRWMEDGKTIELSNVASYFGPFSLSVISKVNAGCIEATFTCSSERMPQQVSLRIPHPAEKKPVKVIGGNYDPGSESVIISPFAGRSTVKIEF